MEFRTETVSRQIMSKSRNEFKETCLWCSAKIGEKRGNFRAASRLTERLQEAKVICAIFGQFILSCIKKQEGEIFQKKTASP